MAEIVNTILEESTGREILVYDNGTQKYKDNGYFVTNNSKYALTPERARELVERRKMKGIMSQLRGLAASEGVELPPDAEMEQIIEGAGNALEAMTKHFAQTFQKSGNLRGMAEGYRQLAAPLIGEKAETNTVNNSMTVIALPDDVAKAIADMRRLMKAQQAGAPNEANKLSMEIIEGKFNA